MGEKKVIKRRSAGQGFKKEKTVMLTACLFSSDTVRQHIEADCIQNAGMMIATLFFCR
jgi:hypothetical protein